jgi:hypothetical protein
MFLARNARFRWCSRGIWRAVSLAHRLGKWKREAGTKPEKDPSTSVPSFLRAGGMTGLGKRREEFKSKFQISNEAKGSPTRKASSWLPRQSKIKSNLQRQKSRQDAGATRERWAAFTCGRRRSWRLRLCLAPGLSVLLAMQSGLRRGLHLALVTMRLLMRPAMRLAEGRDWLLPAPN